jgi:hypothetical protein
MGSREVSAKMTKRKKPAPELQKPLDMVSGKRRRGRPGIRASEVFGRAQNYRWILEQVWQRLREPLSQARTEEEIIRAFADNASPYEREFVPALAPLILQVLHDPKFPKREPRPLKRKSKSRKPKPNPRIVFLADSLAGRGWISPRRSRDICARERTKERQKSKHHIIRREYYIECSCGYKGPGRDDACRKCGAEIPPSFGFIAGLGFR